MSRLAYLACIFIVLELTGCGSSSSTPDYDVVPFTGRVTLDGKPLPNAIVQLVPVGTTKSPGGQAITDGDGKYEINLSANTPNGVPLKGIVPGEYQVRLSKFVRPDGTEIPADSKEPPINLGAIESIPPKYSNPTGSSLQAKVPEAGGTQDFELTSS